MATTDTRERAAATATMADGAVSEEAIAVALVVVAELREHGRPREVEAIFALVRAEVARQSPAFSEEDLDAEDIAALERGEEDILTGRVIPHEVVLAGHDTVERYMRRREAGEVDAQTSAAVAAARDEILAERATDRARSSRTRA